MQNKECVLLLTASIKPTFSDIPPDFRSDAQLRLNDYKIALTYWLNYEDRRISSIVFVENSGSDLNILKDLVDKKNIYKRNVEFLQYTASPLVAGIHYGYSELEMIDNACKDSSLIRQSDFIIKVTGRLYFPKLSILLDKLSDNFSIIVDSRHYKFFSIIKEYVVIALFITETAFYINNLFDAKRYMTPYKCGQVELLYFNILKPLYLKNSREVMMRFPINVEPVGIGAHWNVNYSSNQKKLKSFIRGIFRTLLPQVWI